MNFILTFFVAGLEQGEEHSKQITTVCKAIVYTTLDLQVKSLILSVSGNVMGFL